MSKVVYRISENIERAGWKGLLITVPFFALLNLGFSAVNTYALRSPLFLDSFFTVAGAVCFGPAAGVIIAVLTNLGMEVIYGFAGWYWPFMVCGISTALITGFMAKKGYFKKQIHLTLAILAITASNALLGAFVAYLFFSGDSGVGIDVLVSAFTETGMSVLAAAFIARIPANLIDKMIAVYVGYGIKVLYDRGRGRSQAGS